MAGIIRSSASSRRKMSKLERYESIWSELCPDMLSLVFARLPFIDQLSFRGVCKSWRSAGWTNHNGTDYANPPIPLWEMRRSISSFKKDGSLIPPPATLYLTDLSTERSYSIDIPEIENCKLMAARGGWVLVAGPSVSRGATITFPVFFLNPFTRQRMELPDFDGPSEMNFNDSDVRMEVTASPNTSKCVVFAVAEAADGSTLWTSTWRRGDVGWKERYHRLGIFIWTRVFYVNMENGVFDHLGLVQFKQRKLVVYDPYLERATVWEDNMSMEEKICMILMSRMLDSNDSNMVPREEGLHVHNFPMAMKKGEMRLIMPRMLCQLVDEVVSIRPQWVQLGDHKNGRF